MIFYRHGQDAVHSYDQMRGWILKIAGFAKFLKRYFT